MNEPSVIVVPTRVPITWDVPKEPATPRHLSAIAVAGVVGAIALPTNASGIGYVIVAVACAGSTWWMMRRIKLESALWAVLALALVSVTAFRDSSWLATLCLVGACGAASIAVAGGRSVAGLAIGALAVPIGFVLSLPWVTRGLAALRRQSANRRAARILLALALSVLLLLVFVPLLAGADAAFAEILSGLTPQVDPGSVVRWIGLFVLVGFGAAAAGLVAASPPEVDAFTRKRKQLSRVEWAMPVGILALLFTGFALVQFAALFGGAEYVQRTANLSYATYARSGFWQLLAVTLLTLGVVTAAARWARRETRADRVWLRALLGALCALMLVVVASALTRMWAYQKAYGFTVERVVVEACELWLGLVYLLIIAAGVRLGAGWLPRAVVGSGLAGLLVFAWLDPERIIAGHNVERYRQTGKIDVEYLSTLSYDAWPELATLDPSMRPCVTAAGRDRDWRNWNLSRSRQEPTQQRCRSL
ncbi:DUF4173 domain-containing protein [Actinocrispum sp. NPDC049592]|uniref:DUF4153 domain-containing protein n=1 Tax=Actinocrispum sp. NPDC049592 TaxID=3154835 RepID=UPI00342FAF83